jgi:hypothetical protein
LGRPDPPDHGAVYPESLLTRNPPNNASSAKKTRIPGIWAKTAYTISAYPSPGQSATAWGFDRYLLGFGPNRRIDEVPNGARFGFWYCEKAADGDADVDLADVADFQRMFKEV